MTRCFADRCARALLRLLFLASMLFGVSRATLAAAPDVSLMEFRTYRPSTGFLGNGGPDKPLFAALRSEQDWKRLWSQIETHLPRYGDRREFTPFIDFRSETLIVAAPGVKPTGGWSVAIQSMREFPARIQVVAIELKPGKKCVTTSATTHPIALALIPRTDKPVDFEIIRGETLCK